MGANTAGWLVRARIASISRSRGKVSAELGVGLAAGFVFAAGARIVRVVDENVVVARGADHAVYCFVELLVSCTGGMFFAALFAAHCH